MPLAELNEFFKCLSTCSSSLRSCDMVQQNEDEAEGGSFANEMDDLLVFFGRSLLNQPTENQNDVLVA